MKTLFLVIAMLALTINLQASCFKIKSYVIDCNRSQYTSYTIWPHTVYDYSCSLVDNLYTPNVSRNESLRSAAGTVKTNLYSRLGYSDGYCAGSYTIEQINHYSYEGKLYNITSGGNSGNDSWWFE